MPTFLWIVNWSDKKNEKQNKTNLEQQQPVHVKDLQY